MSNLLQSRLFVVISSLVCCLSSAPSHAREPGVLRRAFPPAASAPTPQEIRFTNKGMGEIQTDDGTTLAFTSCEASDGVALIAMHKEYPSALYAMQKLDREIKKATKILEQAARKDDSGRVVGKRVVAVFRSSEPDKTAQAVLWTYGPHFHEILSKSLADASELEKKLRTDD